MCHTTKMSKAEEFALLEGDIMHLQTQCERQSCGFEDHEARVSLKTSPMMQELERLTKIWLVLVE